MTINPPHVTAALDQAWAAVGGQIDILVAHYPNNADRRELTGALYGQAMAQNETPAEAVAALATLLACAIARLADQHNERKRS